MSQSGVLLSSGLDKSTYINIGAHGELSGKLHTSSADIDNILAVIKQAPTPKVIMHFHGGLVSEEAGELTARRMVPLYKSVGAQPVVFIWETGFLETIEHNLGDIYNTKLFKKILAYAVQQLAKRLNVPTPGRGAGPTENITSIEARLFAPGGLDALSLTTLDVQARGGAVALSEGDLEPIRQQSQAEIEEQLQAELAEDEVLTNIISKEVPSTPLLDGAKVAEGQPEAARGIISIIKLAYSISVVVYETAKRYLEHRDHGFGATVVEEILREFYMADFGAWVWGGMKDVAEKMWSANTGLSGIKLHGGRYFIEGLSKLQQERPALTIDVVGHSAGSIAICMMLRTAAAANIPLKIRNIILMAPACTTSLLHDEIVVCPQRFQQFRMFTMTDAFECANHLLSIVYNRSLLYLISGILEPQEVDIPLAGMMRFDTGKKPFTAQILLDVQAFLFPSGAGATQRTVLARTMITAPNATAGYRSNAARHQDFNTDADTLDSLVEILK